MESVQAIRKLLEKKFSETLGVFPDFNKIKVVDVIPTSSSIIDTVTGIGGFPRGRVTEIHGDYSTGKTTILVQTIAALQKRDPKAVVLYVDYEHAFDLPYAHKLGVDLNSDRFIFCQPEDLEQGHAILDAFLTDDCLLDLIVIDSAAAMIPRDEMQGEVSDSARPGLQAQLMSKMLSKVTKKLGKGKKPALVILNQIRIKFDFRNPRNTGPEASGGMALKFYTTLRLKLEQSIRTGDEKRLDGKQAGTDQMYTRTWVRVTAVKNKLAPPYMRGKFCIDFGEGINNLVSVADLAEEKLGIMGGAGYFKYTGDTTETSFAVRGRAEFHKLLAEKPEILRELEKKVVSLLHVQEISGMGLRNVETVKETEQQVVIDDSDAETLMLDSN